jgi:hypothetical protein
MVIARRGFGSGCFLVVVGLVAGLVIGSCGASRQAEYYHGLMKLPPSSASSR